MCFGKKENKFKKMQKYLRFPDMNTKNTFMYELDEFQNSLHNNSDSVAMESLILKFIRYIDTINDLYDFGSHKFVKSIYDKHEEEIAKEFLSKKGYSVPFGTATQTLNQFKILGYGNVSNLSNEQILENYIHNKYKSQNSQNLNENVQDQLTRNETMQNYKKNEDYELNETNQKKEINNEPSTFNKIIIAEIQLSPKENDVKEI
jgi:hypothetical protein